MATCYWAPVEAAIPGRGGRITIAEGRNAARLPCQTAPTLVVKMNLDGVQLRGVRPDNFRKKAQARFTVSFELECISAADW